MMDYEFAVVVPYFQRDAGVLRRALVGIAAQTLASPILTVIVDDGSPAPATTEVQSLTSHEREHIVVLRQTNRGVGAARNAGLEYVGTRASFIAFLDSDDEWMPDHLLVAKAAFEAGADFYFCDAIQRDGHATVFDDKQFDERSIVVDEHASLYEFGGDTVRLILAKCPIITSAVAYRRSELCLKFRTELLTAGEDFVFWLEAALTRKRTLFCRRPQVQIGHGINIHASAQWGSNAHLTKRTHMALQNRIFKQLLAGDPEYIALVVKLQKSNRDAFAAAVPATLLHDKKLAALAIIARFVALDPAAAAAIARALLRRLARRPQNRARNEDTHA